MADFTFTSEKRESMGGWSRNVRVGDQEYACSVRRGKSVRIPYKPRGQNRGWQWHGTMCREGRCLWSDRVPGTIGCRGLLIEAGIID